MVTNIFPKCFVFLCSLAFYLRIKFRRDCDIKSFPRIKGWVRIVGKGSIRIGSGFSCNSGQRFNPIGGDSQCQFIVREGAVITVGNNVGMSNVSVVCWSQVSILDNVMLGGGVKIYDTDFHPLGPETRQASPQERSLIRCAAVSIEDGAFVGAHSIILKGVKIGSKAIIGAGSRVRTDIPNDVTFFN